MCQQEKQLVHTSKDIWSEKDSYAGTFGYPLVAFPRRPTLSINPKKITKEESSKVYDIPFSLQVQVIDLSSWSSERKENDYIDLITFGDLVAVLE
jgi:hypothetical protein